MREGCLGDSNHVTVLHPMVVEGDQSVVGARRVESGLDDGFVEGHGLVEPAHLLEVLGLEKTLDELDVVRIAEAALAQVQTYDDKRAFYEKTRMDAKKAIGRLPQAEPRKPR